MNAMKKLLLSLLGILVALPILAQDFTYTYGNSTLTYSVLSSASKTCSVKAPSAKTISSVEIPQTVVSGTTVYTVTEISESAFADCTNLTSIALPPSISAIGASAFSGCTKLASAYLGPNITSIGSKAFYNAPLTALYITAQKAPSLGSNALNNFTGKLYLQGASARTAFSNNSSWKNYTSDLMPTPTSMKVTNASKATGPTVAFGKTSTLKIILADGKSVRFSTSYEASETLPSQKVFWHSEDPTKVAVANNGNITMKAYSGTPIKVIGQSIYAGGPVIEISVSGGYPYTYEGSTLYYSVTDEQEATCTVVGPGINDVENVVIPATVSLNDKVYTVTAINEIAFHSSALKSIVLPNTIVDLGNRAFYLASGLKEIKLPNSLRSINGAVFQSSGLTSIEIPNSVIYWSSYVFKNCANLETVTISNSLTGIPAYQFEGCISLSSVILPPAVESIGTSAFKGCTALATVYMGPNVDTIEEEAFSDAPLENIYITRQVVPTLKSNSFSSFDATLHLQGEQAKSLYQTAEIWKNFKAVTLMATPQSLSIVNSDFATGEISAKFGATGSGSFIIADGVSYPYTSKLTSDKSLDVNQVFWRSTNAASVTVNNNGLVTMVRYSGEPVKIIAETLYASGPVIELSVKGGYWYTSNGVELCYSVTNESAATCTVVGPVDKTIESVVIPATVNLNGKDYTVTSINSMAFNRCRSLASVEIPNTVTSLGNRSFFSTTSLKNIVIPSSVRTIDGAAFQYSGLTSVEIPNSVSYWGTYIFSDCAALANVTLGNSLPDIGARNFQNCTSLKSIILPPSVKSIGARAFLGCTSLEKIYMGPNVANIGELAFDKVELGDIYITAQSAPSLQKDSFSNYGATLHLQGMQTQDVYKKAEYWENFTQAKDTMTIPESMSTYNGINLYSHTPVVANFGETATHMLPRFNCNAVKYTTKLNTSSSASPLDVPTIFWKSSNSKLIYVDFSGNFIINAVPSEPVVITAQSIYADGPEIEITVTGCIPYTYQGQTLYYTILDEASGTCAVTAPVDSDISTAIIPQTAKLNGKNYTVVRVGDQAFFQCALLSEVSLPNTITFIGNRAFYGAKSLEDIVIPNSVTSVSGAVFQGTGLRTIVLPNSVKYCGSYVFADCQNLTTVILSHSLSSLPNYTFLRCSKLQSVVLPPAIKSIGFNAFDGCKKLESVYIGPNVSSIEHDAFANTTSALANLYITRPTPPELKDNALGSFSGYLWLQGGDSTKQRYQQSNAGWKGVAVDGKIKPMVEPENIVILDVASASRIPMRVESEYNSSTHIFATPGETMSRTAKVLPEGSVTVPDVFWNSSDPSKVYVEHDGKIEVRDYPEIAKPVVLTATSLYANSPTHTIIVDNYHMTDVDEIVDGNIDMDDADGRLQIFTPAGQPAGDSLNNLAPGIYIVNQGKKTVKITVR